MKHISSGACKVFVINYYKANILSNSLNFQLLGQNRFCYDFDRSLSVTFQSAERDMAESNIANSGLIGSIKIKFSRG